MNHMSKLHQHRLQHRMGSMVTIGIVVLLIGLTVLNYWRQPREYEAKLIAKDLTMLADVFARIDKRCRIMEFDGQINTINFLNVKSFNGSEVGPMNLAYPTQWQGPYLTEHPKIQDKDYQIVKTRHGYFITPGNGVTLPNGKVIGKDIILDENADIAAMLNDEKMLKYKDTPLAVSLPLVTSTVQRLIMENVADTEEDMV
ncbi:MAG: hypothetical protein P4L31_04750 [Candidatus Babeliales bacterium]|nr:hypothetical protein [Candidatus Babeliales bacterium]